MAYDERLSCPVGDVVTSPSEASGQVVVIEEVVVEEVIAATDEPKYAYTHSVRDDLSHLEKLTPPHILSLVESLDPRPKLA